MYSLKEGVFIKSISENQSVIFDYNNSYYFSLDATSTEILELVIDDKFAHLDDIAQKLENKYDVDQQTLTSDINDFLGSLLEKDLLVSSNVK
ncbi:PqqD family protein [Terribacillus sp. AE2B 122]|uniref:PqqD family protein n=1 Tax=Terribacillus sp. AE2B 122 TaxID=1331902 RepID=UPI001582DF4B|nr:PqqD family protein [Terribacillus sp. AE2B 122]